MTAAPLFATRDALREWGPDGILRAALTHALDHYSGPTDDTVPVLRGWLARVAAAEVS